MRVRKKYFFEVLEAYKHYHDWMFFDCNLTQLEILEPTLGNLELMQNFKLTYVVKGFRHPIEFSFYNKFRIKYGMATLMLSTRCLGPDIFVKAISAMANNESLPSDQEIKEEIENNRLLPIVSKKDEQRIIERERYIRLRKKYFLMFQRLIYKLYRQRRVETLSLIF